MLECQVQSTVSGRTAPIDVFGRRVLTRLCSCCRYNATICACFWNGTACANFCEANSTSFGFRGYAIDVKGQLRKSVYVPAVGSPPPLTPAQLKQLRDVDSVGAALVLAGEIDSRPSYVVGVCDAKAALTAVRGITSISPGNVFSNDFWGMGCGTEVGSGAPAWQRLAHEYLTKSMTWWMANNNLDICDSSKPDTCSFCNVSSAEAAQCLKSPDGKPSPASNTSVFGESSAGINAAEFHHSTHKLNHIFASRRFVQAARPSADTYVRLVRP